MAEFCITVSDERITIDTAGKTVSAGHGRATTDGSGAVRGMFEIAVAALYVQFAHADYDRLRLRWEINKGE